MNWAETNKKPDLTYELIPSVRLQRIYYVRISDWARRVANRPDIAN